MKGKVNKHEGNNKPPIKENKKVQLNVLEQTHIN